MSFYKSILLCCCSLMMLGACQTLSTAEVARQTQDQLDRIQIAEPNTRFEQIFNRQLRDNLNQNSGLRDITLVTSLSETNASTLSVKGKTSNLSKTVMTLSYRLVDRVSNEELTKGVIKATATSGTVDSYFGQDQSKQFAAERLTKQLADRLTLRLRRYFLDN